MSFGEVSFYSVCIAVQSVCIFLAVLTLHREAKSLDDLYSLMVKELWSLRGLIERTTSVESLDKELGKNSKFTGTDL